VVKINRSALRQNPLPIPLPARSSTPKIPLPAEPSHQAKKLIYKTLFPSKDTIITKRNAFFP
jgi:hypothetical protein